MRMSWGGLVWILVVAATVAISNAAVLFMLVKMPARYFCGAEAEESGWKDRHVVLRWVILIAKNLAGSVLILLGVLLSLPGVPGPGVVLVLIGVTLLNFPGKRRLERRMIGIPGVFRIINALRERFGQPPLLLDPVPTPSSPPAEEPGRF